MRVIVEADGGSRGNPGPAAYGTVVRAESGEVRAARGEQIGRATNNVAEYRGLIAGLEAARELGATEVQARLDSKLVVEQMSGRWKIKHPDMAELAARARRIAQDFTAVEYQWVPRADNAHADRLVNEALDGSPTFYSAADDAAAAGGARSGGAAEVPAADTGSAGKAADRSSAPGWTGATGAPARLLLLRHGQTPLSVQRRYSGHGDPALTELGLRQAAGAARRLGTRGQVAAIVSSPLTRTRQTAEAAAETLGLKVQIEPDLIETDFGDWEGLTFAEAAAATPALHQRWLSDPSVPAPGGESFTEVAERVGRARRRITERFAGRDVLIVSHVTPIKTLLREALDAGPALLYRLHLDLASLSIAEFYPDGGSSVRLVNDTAHLP